VIERREKLETRLASHRGNAVNKRLVLLERSGRRRRTPFPPLRKLLLWEKHQPQIAVDELKAALEMAGREL
jgi:hypothetical protein